MKTLCLGLIALLAASAADLRKELTLHATFDGSTEAKAALGDKRLYSAADYKDLSAAQPGLGDSGVAVAKGKGQKGGDALWFPKKNTKAVFFRAERNVTFDPKAWSGTISFWLSLDPETDLEPGYTDPIQITDKSFDDSAIWVDFTKDDKPRHFRLGIFGAKSAWNPSNLNPDQNPAFLNRLVVEKKYPFAKGKWTHVAITHEALGSGRGRARLYLDGRLVGETPGIEESFAWDQTKATIRLGVNYTGLLDDLAIFRRPLTAAEVRQIAGGSW